MERVKVEASEEDIKAIEDWLITEPHLPDRMDNILIRRFLYCCKHSLQVTKTTIDHYFTLRYHAPEIFSNRDPMDPGIQQVFTMADICPLPQPTKQNYRVFICRLSDCDPDKYFFCNTVKTFFMLADVRIATELPLTEGEVPVFDMAGVTLKHMTKIVLSVLKKYMAYIQEAHPVRLREVHVINCFSIVDKLYNLVKPMISEEVAKYIHFHSPGSESLYEHIPKEILPEEYGGGAGPIGDIRNSWKKRMEVMRDYFLDEEKWKVDESKRPETNKNKTSENLLNVGSFRSLSID